MSKKEINIHINGESKKIKAEKSIEMLLKELNLNKSNIAIEINREIVNKSYYNSYLIKENDKIEIVNFPLFPLIPLLIYLTDSYV